jgi:hypothetical protein
LFGEEPTWIRPAEALEKRGLVKATGPDLDKVLDTMVELGPRYRHLVVGYPRDSLVCWRSDRACAA